MDERFYSGKQFVIEAKNNSAENVYVQSAKLDGQTLKNPWFLHKDLVDGGKLILDMGKSPSESAFENASGSSDQ